MRLPALSLPSRFAMVTFWLKVNQVSRTWPSVPPAMPPSVAAPGAPVIVTSSRMTPRLPHGMLSLLPAVIVTLAFGPRLLGIDGGGGPGLTAPAMVAVGTAPL